MTVRYAFAARTAALLERWHNLVSNKRTGGTGLASSLKTMGMFYWLAPNPNIGESVSEKEQFVLVNAYELQGCWPKNLKPSDADHTSGNTLVTYDFKMQIDRYYPVRPADLQFVQVPGFVANLNATF
jgi:hypothetical protein